jgi:hypothetical protein
MLAAGRKHTDRLWAVEGCSGIGRHVAQRLVADGGTVVDVPAKLSCGVPLLSQARDLGGVRCLPSEGVAELSVFKFRGAIPERVQTTQATRSSLETKGQARGSDEFSAPTGLGAAELDRVLGEARS